MTLTVSKIDHWDESEAQVRVMVNQHEQELDHHSKTRQDQFNDKFDTRVWAALLLWYLWSALTLFLNKYLIDLKDGDIVLLSVCQIVIIVILGSFQRKHAFFMYPVEATVQKIPTFSRDMIIIGSFRFLTVFLGLYALKYVEVSFTETVKSTAPAFTLLISSLILKEKTSLLVKVSILPVMGGLALCSANEAKFNFEGFVSTMSSKI